MTRINHFEIFLLTGVLLNLTPGNDTIYILTKSITQGRKAGIISALGIGTGGLVHTSLAAFGLSMLIAKSILLFNTIKYAGALYLLYVGYKMLKSKPLRHAANPQLSAIMNYWKIYLEGIFTNVFNPKVALFFITFLPQFINPQINDTVVPIFTLGATFIATGTIWCLILAIFASIIFSKMKRNHRISTYINYICGLVLIGLGIKVALPHNHLFGK